MKLEEYIQGQFVELASSMFAGGLEGGFGGPQHRDMVQLWVGGSLIMSSPATNEDLDKLMLEVCAEDWLPGPEWNWPILVPVMDDDISLRISIVKEDTDDQGTINKPT